MGIKESCDYGPCLKEDDYDCLYKTRLSDYETKLEGTIYEDIDIAKYALKKYHDKTKQHSQLVQLQWKPCEYFHQKWISVKSSHTIYNYKYFLSDLFYSSGVNKRKLLILDEAHTLESEVSTFKNFIINKEYLNRFFPKLNLPENKPLDVDTYVDFCTHLKERFYDYINKGESLVGNDGDKKKAIDAGEKNLIDALAFEKNLSVFLDDLKSNKDNWLVTNMVKNDNDNKISRIKMEPLDVSNYFVDIFDKGSVSLLMSATILSKDNLCKAVGLKKDQVKFIKIEESEFPVEHRPIYLMNVAWLSAKTMSESLPHIAKVIDNLLSVHKNDKGIIHTTSYSQLQFIKNNISKNNFVRLIETNPKLDRNDMILKHFESLKPTVLISPSMYLGIDLKDDLSRFQIIVKVPYPDLTDKKISVLKQRNPKWYEWNTILRLIQAYGRSIRNSEDYANTYILDSSISFLLKNGKDMIPKWFSEAIVSR
jgi:Rad3-related DNA helicase